MIALWLYSPAGVVYDLLGPSEYKVFEEGLPDIEEDLQDKYGLVSISELNFTADNATGWWDTVRASLDPDARFDEAGWEASGVPGIWFLQLRKNGTVRWEGDLVDPCQLSMDSADDAKTCSFTVTGSLGRLRRYNAALVRRPIPAPFTGVTTDRKTKPKWITFPDPVSTYGLVKKDKLFLQKFGAQAEVSSVEVEIAATHADDPDIPEDTVCIKQRLKFDLNDNASVYCSSPYYRDKTAGWLVNELLNHCNVPEGKRVLDAALETVVVPYADFKDKDCGDAIEELATVIPAVVWRDGAGVHVVKLDAGLVEGEARLWVSGTTPDGERHGRILSEPSGAKALDGLLMAPVVTARWENYHSAVKVEGATGRVARRGRLDFPSSTLEITTDFAEYLSDIQSLAESLWPFYATPRSAVEALIADDGTRYTLWQEVTIGGTPYKVAGISEPFLSVDEDHLDSLTLRLWEVGEPDLMDPDAEDDDEVDDTDPPPECVIEAVTKHYDDYPLIREQYPADEWKPIKVVRECVGDIDGQPIYADARYRLWIVIFTCPCDLRRLVDFVVTRWDPLKDRTKVRTFENFPDLGIQSDGKYYAPLYVRAGKSRLVDAQAVYFDGQKSAETDGVALGYPDEPGTTEPGEGDEEPAAVTADDITYETYPDDISGTSKVEASLNVTVALAPNTAHDSVKVFVVNGKGKQITAHAKTGFASGGVTVHFRRQFYKNENITIEAVEVHHKGGHFTRTDGLDITLTAGTGMSIQASADLQTGPHPLMVGFSLTVTDGTAPYTYQWEFGDGTTSSAQNPTHQYENQGSYIARVHVEDSKGARATDAHLIITVIDATAGPEYPLMAYFIGTSELYARFSSTVNVLHLLQAGFEGRTGASVYGLGSTSHQIQAEMVGATGFIANFAGRPSVLQICRFDADGITSLSTYGLGSEHHGIDARFEGETGFTANFAGRPSVAQVLQAEFDAATWLSVTKQDSVDPLKADARFIGATALDANFAGRPSVSHSLQAGFEGGSSFTSHSPGLPASDFWMEWRVEGCTSLGANFAGRPSTTWALEGRFEGGSGLSCFGLGLERIRVEARFVGMTGLDANVAGRPAAEQKLQFEYVAATAFTPHSPSVNANSIIGEARFVGETALDANFQGRPTTTQAIASNYEGSTGLFCDWRAIPNESHVLALIQGVSGMDGRLRVAGVQGSAIRQMGFPDAPRPFLYEGALALSTRLVAGSVDVHAGFVGNTSLMAGLSGRTAVTWVMEMRSEGATGLAAQNDWTNPATGITVAVESKTEDAPGTKAKECYLKVTLSSASPLGASHINVHATRNGNPMNPHRVDLDQSATSAVVWWHRCAKAGDLLQVTRIALWHKHKRTLLTGGPWPSPAKCGGADETGFGSTGLPPAPPDADQTAEPHNSWYFGIVTGSGSPHSFDVQLLWGNLTALQKEQLWRAILEVYNPTRAEWVRHEEIPLRKLVNEGRSSVFVKIHVSKNLNSGANNYPNIRMKLEDVHGQTNATWAYLDGTGTETASIGQPSPLQYYQDENGYLDFGLTEASDGGTLYQSFGAWLLATASKIYMNGWGAWDRPPVLRKVSNNTNCTLYTDLANGYQIYAGKVVRDASGRRFVALVDHLKDSVSKPIPTTAADNTWWHYWTTSLSSYFLDWDEYRRTYSWCSKPEWRDGMMLPVINTDGGTPGMCRIAVLYSARTGSGLASNKLAFFNADKVTDNTIEGEDPPTPPTSTPPAVPEGGGCFAPDVLVMGTSGAPVEISSVRCDRDEVDFVMGVNPEGRLVPTMVLHKFEGDFEEEMVSVAGVRSSPDHLWFHGEREEPLRNSKAAPTRLGVGAVLWGWKGGRFEGVVLESGPEPCGSFVPHNLNTETGNFLVSADGAQWYLVHNAKNLDV